MILRLLAFVLLLAACGGASPRPCIYVCAVNHVCSDGTCVPIDAGGVSTSGAR